MMHSPENIKFPLYFIRMFIQTQSYTKDIQVFWVTSFAFVNKPSSDVCFYQDCPMNLIYA